MVTAIKNLPNFSYEVVDLRDIKINRLYDSEGNTKINTTLGDRPVTATGRFWTSMFSRYGFSKQIFKYFDYQEVFERMQERSELPSIRVCIADGDEGTDLLAVSNPEKPVVSAEQLMGVIAESSLGMKYSEGIITSTHLPRNGRSFEVMGDKFDHQFAIDVPLDGYGQPTTYIALLRQVCSNGLVAMAPAFKSSVQIGRKNDNIEFTLMRVIDQFSSEEGYAAIEHRIEAATKTQASVNEFNELYQMVVRSHKKHLLKENGVPVYKGNIITDLHKVSGDINVKYGLANLDAMSKRRQQSLPIGCSIYDLINYTTEIATHHLDDDGKRAADGFVGRMISAEYDLEGADASLGNEFADFHTSMEDDGFDPEMN